MKTVIKFLFFILYFSSEVNAQDISDFIHVDQFGYLTNATKVAVISNPQVGFNSGNSYTVGNVLELRNFNTDAVVFSATPQPWDAGNIHEQSGDAGWWFNFSSVTTTGTYYVFDSSTSNRSAPFEINANPYVDVIKAATKMFYYNRCNATKEMPYADANWLDGQNFNQDAQVRDAFNQTDASTAKDLTGGWFDAGDYNKYITFAHDPVHQLLSAYQENTSIYTDDWNIPESGDGIPDILNEIKWELDWMRKMINADGSVHIKMGSLDYDINDAAPPSNNTDPRYYAPTCTSASIAIASAFSHASQVFKTIPSLASYAEILEDEAELCWNYMLPFFNTNTLQTDCDDLTVKAGDADWDLITQTNNAVTAAVYLFDISEDEVYANFINSNYEAVEPMVNDFWAPHQPVLLEAMLYYTTMNGVDASVTNNILTVASDAITNDYGDYFSFNANDLYRASSPDWVYYWGSNQTKANIGNLCNIMVKYNVQPVANSDLLEKAQEQMHYFHGVNPLSIVYLSNMYAYGGDKCANEIFHSWFNEGTDWDNAVTSLYGPAPGFLSGGPNQGYTGTLSPPLGQPLQKCYLDYNDGFTDVAYEITEPAIYYQAAYIRFLSNYVNNQTVLSVNDFNADDSLFAIPNPANDLIEIKGINESSELKIYNIKGQFITSLSINNSEKIDVSNLSSGVYFIKIKDDNTSEYKTVKFIKTN